MLEVNQTEESTMPHGELEADAAKPTVQVLRKKPVVKDATDDADADVETRPERSSRREHSKEMIALKNADQMAVKEWLEAMSGQATIQVIVNRREPKMFRDPKTQQMVKCDGMIAKYDKVIDEAELRDAHGGGTYALKVNTRNARGNWEYFTQRTIEIAGDPRIDDVPRNFAPQSSSPQVIQHQPDPVASNLMGRAFDFMAQQATEARRAPPVQHGLDHSQIATIIAPLQATIATLTAQLEAANRNVDAARKDAKEGDPYKDKLLEKMLDTDNARVQSIRMQHESEIRVIKEQAIAVEGRLRDQFQRDMDRMERQHEREIANLRASYDTQKSSLESSQATQKLVLDSEVKRLEREITELKTENAALRAKKEQSLSDKIKEMKDIKELVAGDSDDDDEEKSTLQTIIEAAGNLPVVASLAERFGGGGQQQAAPQQVHAQVQPPQHAPRRRLLQNKTTGAVVIQHPDGRIEPAGQAIPSADGKTQLKIPPLDPATVKTAIEYMEGAFRAGTEAKMFADTARPMIPANVLAAIRELGIDEFLAKVAQLDATSPLATQGGRNWRRNVAKHLLGEADEAKS